jgi:cell division protein FtsB
MNMMGKILVFLVLVFSVMFMTIAVMLYATHKNWREEAASWKQKNEAITKDNETLKQEKQVLHDQYVAARLSSDLAQANAESRIDLLTKTVATLEANKVQADQKLAVSTTTLSTQQTTLQATQDSEKKTRETLTAQLEANDKRAKELVDLISKYHDLKAALPALDERNAQLTAQLAQTTLLLHKLGLTAQDSPDLIPPPVDGTIVALGRRDDPNLIELSMGKDDGLRVNHRVDLYHGKDYLGYAVITELDTSGNRVAAKVMDKKAPIRVGDNFTTRFQSLTLTKRPD